MKKYVAILIILSTFCLGSCNKEKSNKNEEKTEIFKLVRHASTRINAPVISGNPEKDGLAYGKYFEKQIKQVKSKKDMEILMEETSKLQSYYSKTYKDQEAKRFELAWINYFAKNNITEKTKEKLKEFGIPTNN